MTAHRPILDAPVIVARLWKSPRDRARTIVVSLKSFNRVSFVDVRLFETNAAGCSVPTVKGISVGFKQLPELIRALEKARVKAVALGLIDQPKPEATT